MSLGVDTIIGRNTVPQKISQPLYDSVLLPLAGGTLIAPLFALGLGQGTQVIPAGAAGKTENDTNLPPNGQIPVGWEHTTRAIHLVGWSVAVTQAPDMQIAIARAVFFYEIATTRWLTIPARRLTGGSGISFAGATDRIASIGQARGGSDSGYPLPIPIVTGGGLSITAGLRFPGAGGSGATTADVPITVFLEGEYYRRV